MSGHDHGRFDSYHGSNNWKAALNAEEHDKAMHRFPRMMQCAIIQRNRGDVEAEISALRAAKYIADMSGIPFAMTIPETSPT